MKRKDILLLLIPSLVFVLAWMGFSVYHSYINSTISEALNTQILPINPNFDTTTISALKNRTHVNPIYEVNPSLITVPAGEDNVQTQDASSSSKTAAPDNSQNSVSTTGGVLSQ